MSRITERDIELDNYGETYLVTKEGYEFNEERDEGKDAYCNECRKIIEREIYRYEGARCPHCKAFIG